MDNYSKNEEYKKFIGIAGKNEKLINYLKIGELKELIKDLPDDYDVVIVSSDFAIERHILKVNSVGILECEYEEHKALGLCSEEYSTISDETDYCEKLLFPKKETQI